MIQTHWKFAEYVNHTPCTCSRIHPKLLWANGSLTYWHQFWFSTNASKNVRGRPHAPERICKFNKLSLSLPISTASSKPLYWCNNEGHSSSPEGKAMFGVLRCWWTVRHFFFFCTCCGLVSQFKFWILPLHIWGGAIFDGRVFHIEFGPYEVLCIIKWYLFTCTLLFVIYHIYQKIFFVVVFSQNMCCEASIYA